MSKLPQILASLNFDIDDYQSLIQDIESAISDAGYEVVEKNVDKPWGAYLRINSSQADEFVADFFSEITPEQARLGIKGAELSPKLLIVKPAQRLSWQYHDRRAERWHFLTPGAYRRSLTDDESDRISAEAGEVVQFQTEERHRLEGMASGFVVVAEIWQHSDIDNPSNEDDIVRLADDYQR